MSKYFEKLIEDEAKLAEKSLELDGLRNSCSVLYNELCDCGQNNSDSSEEIKNLREDLQFLNLGYKKIFSDYLEQLKLHWGVDVIVFVIACFLSLIPIIGKLMSLAAYISFPFVVTLAFEILEFLDWNKDNFKRVNKLRKETTKEEIESKIEIKESNLEKQRLLYDEKSNQYLGEVAKKNALESVVSKESERLIELRKKCEAGYKVALKEFFDNMTPEQKEMYEKSVDLNIEGIIRKLSQN